MSKSHHKSIIKASLDRLDSLMAIGESRGEAKHQAYLEGEDTWAFTTHKMHSYKTREGYQEHVLDFVSWSRATYGIKHLEDLDARADELACVWLTQQRDAGKSPYTLPTMRSALRLFFSSETLAEAVDFPPRTRTGITRSRGEVARDQEFQPANWQPLLTFLLGTGLRRHEVARVKAGDVILPAEPRHQGGGLMINVKGKGGKTRLVPVLPEYEQHVLTLRDGVSAPDGLLFPRIPSRLDVHSYRRLYAQALYLFLAPDRTLPLPASRLKATDYDREAVHQVSQALGHNRLDVTLNHYLR